MAKPGSIRTDAAGRDLVPHLVLVGVGLVALAIVTVVLLPHVRGPAGWRGRTLTDVPDRAVLALLELPAPVAAAARAAVDDRGLDAVLRQHFAARPPARGLPERGSPRRRLETAEELLDGRLRLPPAPPVAARLPPDWTMDVHGENWRLQLHALEYVAALADAWTQTGEDRFLDAAERIVFDWIERNPFTADPRDLRWSEGATARRLLALTAFFEAARRRPESSAGTLARLLGFVQQHGEHLTDSGVYVPAGNHGITQDTALLAASVAFPDLVDAATWRATALRRLVEDQLRTSFSAEGVQLENSPGYHFFVMRQLERIERLLEANAIPPPPGLAVMLARMDGFAMHVLLPDGRIPAIGDSSENVPRIDPAYLAPRPGLAWSVSGGRTGAPPGELDGRFPASGYAIFRDAWSPAAETTYVNFHATWHAPSPLSHKQDDELSFILFGAGRPWIVDAGKYSYTEDDPFRFFVRSAAAHNGYVAEGAVILATVGAALAGMEPIVSEPGFAAARAWTERFEGARFVRTVVFLRTERILLLFDELAADAERPWVAQLHLAPDLEPALDGLRATCAAPDPSWTLEVVAEPGASRTLTAARGEREPIRGWTSPDWHEIVPTTVLRYERPGARWATVTAVRLRPSDAAPLGDLRFEAGPDTLVATLAVPPRTHSVRVTRTGPLAVEHTIAR